MVESRMPFETFRRLTQRTFAQVGQSMLDRTGWPNSLPLQVHRARRMLCIAPAKESRYQAVFHWMPRRNLQSTWKAKSWQVCVHLFFCTVYMCMCASDFICSSTVLTLKKLNTRLINPIIDRTSIDKVKAGQLTKNYILTFRLSIGSCHLSLASRLIKPQLTTSIDRIFPCYFTSIKCDAVNRPRYIVK